MCLPYLNRTAYSEERAHTQVGAYVQPVVYFPTRRPQTHFSVMSRTRIGPVIVT